MCGMNQEVANVINELRDISKFMSGSISEFLKQLDVMKEDVEDLAMNAEQEAQGVSIIGEMKEKMRACKTDMVIMTDLTMNTDMGIAAAAIKNLETHSLEMFTRLAKLESLHIIPGLDSMKNIQLANWGKWQASAAKLKAILDEHF